MAHAVNSPVSLLSYNGLIDAYNVMLLNDGLKSDATKCASETSNVSILRRSSCRFGQSGPPDPSMARVGHSDGPPVPII